METQPTQDDVVITEAVAIEPVTDYDDVVKSFYEGNMPRGYTIRFETLGGETVPVVTKQEQVG